MAVFGEKRSDESTSSYVPLTEEQTQFVVGNIVEHLAAKGLLVLVERSKQSEY